jgi:uncharacterized membrane protein
MTSIPIIVAIVLLTALVITLVVPGGVLLAPMLLVAVAVWAVIRVAAGRRDDSAAGPR